MPLMSTTSVSLERAEYIAQNTKFATPAGRNIPFSSAKSMYRLCHSASFTDSPLLQALKS